MRLRWLKGALAVLRRAIRYFGVNEAVVAIVLVAADNEAGLAALFLNHVPAERGLSHLIQDFTANQCISRLTIALK
ncbi:hypothetical protein DDY07_21135 [Methylomonas sp. ZR1]|nr:hypothetical protein [Methylomonas sp. ZR1]